MTARSFIEAKEIKLNTLLSNPQEAYRIPIYQRPYSWAKDQWEDLYEDVKEIIDTDGVHFLGSMVVIPEGPHRFGVNYYEIVDGQQRLATLLIWLSAIRDLAKENQNNELAEHLNNTYLFAKEWVGDRTQLIPKLQLGSAEENDIFLKILEGKANNIEIKILYYINVMNILRKKLII